MSDAASIDKLARDIREIYAGDPGQPEERISTYVQERLGGLPAGERVGLLQNLIRHFEAPRTDADGPAYPDDEVLTRLFSLVLGAPVTSADLSSADLLERLAESLNTIFDALNKLVAVIDSTLLGKERGEETIRQVIGFHLEGQDRTKSLESYLGQINQAFLVAQKASKKSAHRMVGKILAELDPDKISQEAGGGLKFGPLRKAELYDEFEMRMKKFRKWYESGRFTQELQREFEKNCRPT